MPGEDKKDNALEQTPLNTSKRQSTIVVGKVMQPQAPADAELPPEAIIPQSGPSWTLQQFFDGEINLDVELSQRFTNVPLLTNAKFRIMGDNNEHGVATISAQDDSVWIIFDVDRVSRVAQASFTLGAMISLQFTLKGLNDVDRARWVALMRREEGGLAFLWGPQRWENDYMICVKRKYFTNIFAFSPGKFEAAVRLTPDVTKQLVDWLETFWQTEPTPEEKDLPPLLSW